MVAVADFKNAISLLTGAVNVVTTAGDAGRHGFTASAVCSVTDTPPTLLVCMNRSARSHDFFIANKVLTVNVLGPQHQHISSIFSSPATSAERFESGNWTQLTTGSPVLVDALVSFDCHIEMIQEVGTHTIFICPIVAIQTNDYEQGLVYFNRAYHRVGQLQVA